MNFRIDDDEMTGTINGIHVKIVFKGSCKKCPANPCLGGIGSRCMYYERKDKQSGHWKKMNIFERLWYGLKQGIKP